MEWIEIDLQDLYHIGHIDITAAELLQRILDAYNVEYQVLVNCSPDVGVDYYIDDEEFKEAFSKAMGWQEERKVIEDYAIRKNAVAVVELFDGYEWSAALIYPSDD
jgi:hypothetical protein